MGFSRWVEILYILFHVILFIFLSQARTGEANDGCAVFWRSDWLVTHSFFHYEPAKVWSPIPPVQFQIGGFRVHWLPEPWFAGQCCPDNCTSGDHFYLTLDKVRRLNFIPKINSLDWSRKKVSLPKRECDLEQVRVWSCYLIPSWVLIVGVQTKETHQTGGCKYTCSFQSKKRRYQIRPSDALNLPFLFLVRRACFQNVVCFAGEIVAQKGPRSFWSKWESADYSFWWFQLNSKGASLSLLVLSLEGNQNSCFVTFGLYNTHQNPSSLFWYVLQSAVYEYISKGKVWRCNPFTVMLLTWIS